MSAVVLRCPNCGTTRAAEGECDACHEAAVRYYCTNHTPGRWVDSRACPACGAAFGDPPRAPAPPPVASRPPTRSPPRAPSRRPGGAPSPSRAPSPPSSPLPGWPPHVRRRGPTIEEDFDDLDPAGRSAAPVEVDLAPAGRAVGGCLMRLVFLVLLAFLAMVVGISLLGGSLLRLFGFS